MLEILPRPEVNALDKKGAAHDDDEERDSNNPPKHARLILAQTIAETTDSFDSVARFAQLLAQAADMSINGARINHAFITPDVAKQAIPLLHPAAPLHKSAQQFVLEAGEMNYFAVDGDVMAKAIDADRAGEQRLRFDRGLAVTQDGLSAEHDIERR